MDITKENIFLDLVKYLSLNNSFYNKTNFLILSKLNNKQKILNMFIHINELEKYYTINKLQIFKILYYNRISINSILYDLESNIALNTDGNILELSHYFYISLLIEDEPTITNYTYSIDFIKELNEKIKKIKNNEKNKDLYIKIILDLIDNYEQLEESDENKDEIGIIKNNIFNNFAVDNNNNIYKSKKIDEIYSDIILFLIKNYKLEDYDYSYNIIKKIDLELIEITEYIFKQLIEILDNNNIYINK